MTYATLTANMRNYGQTIVVEEGIIVKLILINTSGTAHTIKTQKL